MKRKHEKVHDVVTSKKGRIPSYVLFVNNSERDVRTFWIDFWGRKVSYKVLAPGAKQNVSSYVDHVWIFKDVESGERLVTSRGEKIFIAPNGTKVEQPMVVEITIPVFSLASMCMRSLRKHFKPEEIENFYMPNLLKKELLHYCDVEPYCKYNS